MRGSEHAELTSIKSPTYISAVNTTIGTAADGDKAPLHRRSDGCTGWRWEAVEKRMLRTSLAFYSSAGKGYAEGATAEIASDWHSGRRGHPCTLV